MSEHSDFEVLKSGAQTHDYRTENYARKYVEQVDSG
jgi:hypothetical protein